MTEFEELALKKIVKDYLIDCIYRRLNTVSGRHGISNAEISKYIGWDPAGFNQKYNRSNDLRITTFIKIYVALMDLITEKELEVGLDESSITKLQLDELITEKELHAGALFNHISAVAEGKSAFLNREKFIKTYRDMKPFVLVSNRHKRFSDKEMKVYLSYYQILNDTTGQS